MSASIETPPRTRVGALRTGLVLAGILGLLDLATGIVALFGGFFAPDAVGVAMIALGTITVVLVPLAWRGRRWPSWVVVASRLLSAAGGLPAFFVPDVPPEAVVGASAGIIAAVVAAVLIAFGVGAKR